MKYTEIKLAIDTAKAEGKLFFSTEKQFRKLSADSTQEELDRFVKRHKELFTEKSAEQKLVEEYIYTRKKFDALSTKLAEIGEATPSSMLDALSGATADFAGERERYLADIQEVSAHLRELEEEAEKYAYTDAYGRQHSILKGVYH